MNKAVILFAIFICLTIIGCSTGTLPLASQSPTAFSTPVTPSATSTQPLPTATQLLSQTPTSPPPSHTPTPTITPTPSDTPTPSSTPVSWGNIPISVENAASIVQKGVWGLGSSQWSTFASSSRVFIQRTVFGVYLYRMDDLQLISFLPDVIDYILSRSEDLLFGRLPDGSIQVNSLPSGEEKYSFPPIAVLSPWMKDYIYSQLPKDRPALENELFEQVSRMTALAVSPDGTSVAIGFGDASIGLWKLDSGELFFTLKNDIVRDVIGLVFSPDGEKLLSTGSDGDVAVWQVADGQLLWRLPHVGHSVGQPFSLDGSLVALEITKGTSSWVAIRDARFGGELAPQVVGVVASDAISPDNKRLVTTWYGAVKVWSLPNLILQSKIETGLDWPQASYSSDGQYILINGGEQAYLVDDLKRDESYPTPTPQLTPEVDVDALFQLGHVSDPIGLRYPAPDQAYAWGRASDQKAWVWDLTKNIKTNYDFASPLTSTPDLSFAGDRLAACTENGLIQISLPDDQLTNFGRCREPELVRYSVDGKLIFRSSGNVIDVLDSSNGDLLYNFRGHTFIVEDMAVSQDGIYLVSSSNFQRTQGRELIWWQLDQPRKIWNWMVTVYPYDHLLAADFQPEEGVLYTALGGIRSWRLSDGIQDHLDTDRIGSLALSPVENLLMTGDYSGNLHVWSPESWTELVVLTGHRLPIVGVIFSPDGTSLLSLSADGTVRLWGLP